MNNFRKMVESCLKESTKKNQYREYSYKEVSDGLENPETFSHSDITEYINGDTEHLAKFNDKTGKDDNGKSYNKPISEYNSLVAQPHLNEIHKIRLLGNLIHHNHLMKALGKTEPHHYATDIQGNVLYPNGEAKSLLPSFEDMHSDLEYDEKRHNDILATQNYLYTHR